MRVPTINLTSLPDGQGIAVTRGGVRLGTLFQVQAGWVTTTPGHGTRYWRSKPLPSKAAALAARWGDDGLDALHRETLEAA